jgi:hypothetical protein
MGMKEVFKQRYHITSCFIVFVSGLILAMFSPALCYGSGEYIYNFRFSYPRKVSTNKAANVKTRIRYLGSKPLYNARLNISVPREVRTFGGSRFWFGNLNEGDTLRVRTTLIFPKPGTYKISYFITGMAGGRSVSDSEYIYITAK